MALFNVFPAENHIYWNQVGGNWKEWVAMGTKCFIAEGVFSVELLAYEISMVSTATWPR